MGNVRVPLIYPWALTAADHVVVSQLALERVFSGTLPNKLRLHINAYVIDKLGDHPGY